ncbi:hypothetical protein F4604DRAFT_1032519 [Suillus subluteus]|nr:hypothetical protein F4604DRAFT_1032519 [Suillus subluteus]
MLEKIDASLKRWEKSHPTVEGRKIIIQCTIGGMTQYLTVAQGMPKDIEKTLMVKARSFIWDNVSKTPISMNILCAPIEEGGKNMLNIAQQNEVIELMWLKGLLKPINECPTWAFFAEVLIAKHARPVFSMRVNRCVCDLTLKTQENLGMIYTGRFRWWSVRSPRRSLTSSKMDPLHARTGGTRWSLR